MSTLYLLPSYLGENSPKDIFSQREIDLIKELKYFIVENEKSARRFIKFLYPEVSHPELNFSILDKKSTDKEIHLIAEPLTRGVNVGLISEAGLPCIADPGNILVSWCHQKDIKVVPICGPSSIILALIASGMNGQKFTFNGYLPIDSKERIKSLQQIQNISKIEGSSQIFMETPYRNQNLFHDLVNSLNSQTKLCIATDITLPTENIKTLRIKDWKKINIELHKKPTIFIIQWQ